MFDLKKYSFEVINETKSDGTDEFVVIFNDCKNIIGVGETVEDAVEEARGNLDAYLSFCEEEGIELPQPTTINWMETYSGKVTLRMPKALHRDIAEYAKKDGLSLNSVINDAIRQYLTIVSLNDIKESTKSELSIWVANLDNESSAMPTAIFQNQGLFFSGKYNMNLNMGWGK